MEAMSYKEKGEIAKCLSTHVNKAFTQWIPDAVTFVERNTLHFIHAYIFIPYN